MKYLLIVSLLLVGCEAKFENLPTTTDKMITVDSLALENIKMLTKHVFELRSFHAEEIHTAAIMGTGRGLRIMVTNRMTDTDLERFMNDHRLDLYGMKYLDLIVEGSDTSVVVKRWVPSEPVFKVDEIGQTWEGVPDLRESLIDTIPLP